MGSLGIYDGHNAGISYVENSSLKFSVEEERFSRIKQHDGRNINHGPPVKSLKWILSQIQDIDKISSIGIGLCDPSLLRYKSLEMLLSYSKKHKDLSLLDIFSDIVRYRSSNDPSINNNYSFTDSEYMDLSYSTQVKRLQLIYKLLDEYGLSDKNIVLSSHHECHHATSWFTIKNREKFISLSLDGRGDALSGLVSLSSDVWPYFSIEQEISSFDSIGHFYSAITAALGFVPVKHEGKITGLAAYGTIQPSLLETFAEFLYLSDEFAPISSLISSGPYGPYPYANTDRLLDKIKLSIAGYSKEDVAATAQFHLEQIVCRLVTHNVKKYSKSSILLSGGVFANVKLNQRISELSCVDCLIVHPGMTDCGISAGAAFLAHKKKNQQSNHHNFYLGPKYSVTFENILEELPSQIYKVHEPENLARDAALLLSKGKVIARYAGNLEYGPRALGNRSILCSATDSGINDWLNKKLSRTEFMPFAPVTLAEDLEKCYIMPTNTDISTSIQYMTVTVNCTAYLKATCPAVVHVDGTARPQIIHKDINPEYYSIIYHYKQLTGIGTLINTSFNIHDQPIVCTPVEAIHAFCNSDLDALLLNQYFITKA